LHIFQLCSSSHSRPCLPEDPDRRCQVCSFDERGENLQLLRLLQQTGKRQ
jgi:hypothetical protein